MTVLVDLQPICQSIDYPSQEQCQRVIQMTLDIVGIDEAKECTIRIVDESESAQLNEQYRGKLGPTNVLSFTFESPIEIDIDLMGDLVICGPLVIQEAAAQNKTEHMHWHHLIVHGCLHLLGYDHLDDTASDQMEALERRIMKRLGHPDPYKMIDML